MSMRMWRQRNTLPLLVRLQKCKNTLEVNLEVLQKFGKRSTWIPSYISLKYIWISCPITRSYIPLCSYYPYIWYPEAVNNPNVPQQKDEYRKCGWSTQWNEYYLTIKKVVKMKFACKWMELETIILAQVTQTPNHMHAMCSVISRY